MARKKWSELSPRSRGLIVGLGTMEGILKLWALIDLKRRPASQVRGSKKRWAVAVVLVNSAGVVPVIYLLYGRRQASGVDISHGRA